MTSTPTRHLTAAETARHLRAALREKFPGQRFSVRTYRQRLEVTYTGDLPVREVNAVAREFRGTDFDSMTDTASFRRTTLDGERVHYVVDSVTVEQWTPGEARFGG